MNSSSSLCYCSNFLLLSTAKLLERIVSTHPSSTHSILDHIPCIPVWLQLSSLQPYYSCWSHHTSPHKQIFSFSSLPHMVFFAWNVLFHVGSEALVILQGASQVSPLMGSCVKPAMSNRWCIIEWHQHLSHLWLFLHFFTHFQLNFKTHQIATQKCSQVQCLLCISTSRSRSSLHQSI